MKWAARLCSLLLTLTWLAIAWFVVIASEDPTTRLGRGLVALALLACAALLLAWRRPRFGGSVAIVAGMVFGTVYGNAARGSGLLMGIGLLTAAAFVLTGVLFIVTPRLQQAPGRARWPGAAFAVLVTFCVLAMIALSLGMGVSG